MFGGYPPIAAAFCGQLLFGDPGSFQSNRIVNNQVPLTVDQFLSYPPGTTPFGVSPGGRLWLCNGLFIDASSAGITSQQETLMSFTDRMAAFFRPTGYPWPNNAENWKNALIHASEVVFGPTTSYPGNQYACTFNLVVRSFSNS